MNRQKSRKYNYLFALYLGDQSHLSILRCVFKLFNATEL